MNEYITSEGNSSPVTETMPSVVVSGDAKTSHNELHGMEFSMKIIKMHVYLIAENAKFNPQ